MNQNPSPDLPESEETVGFDGDGTPLPSTAPAPEAPVVDETPSASSETTQSEGEGDGPRYRLDFTPVPTVELKHPTSSPLAKKFDPTYALSVLSANVDELNKLAEGYPQLKILGNEQSEEWRRAMVEGQGTLLRGMALAASIVRDHSLWRQSVTAGAEELQPYRPKFSDNGEGSKLVGEAAVMKIQALTGLGSVVKIPLWHTGIWVQFKAPTEAALLELDRALTNDKITLGRLTNGLIYSNSSVYFISRLVNFALAHVFDATYKYNRPEDLKEIIRANDIPTLLWGLLCSIYPSGYPYEQPCLTDPSKCMHIVRETLNITKLSWTDNNALTEWQRRLMTRKNQKSTAEEIKRYADEHSFSKDSVIDLNPAIKVELKVPTVAEYERSGFAWVDSIVAQVDQAFGSTLKGDQRNEYIMERGRLTALRQYSHWINRIVIQGKDVIDDPTTIEDVINPLTGDQDLYTNFFNGVGKYIDSTTISMIALPRFDCPACGAPMSEEQKRHPHLVPLDIAQIFFTLLDQRVYRALQRTAL